MKVLVTGEGDAQSRANLRLLLTGLRDVDLQFAPYGEDIVGLVSASSPDVLIVDMCVMGGKGLGLLRELRAALPSLVLIVTTLRVYPEYRQACLDLGVEIALDDFGTGYSEPA